MSLPVTVRPFTLVVLCTAVLLIVYSYCCRLWKFYFFWESGAIGWILLLIGSILFLFQRIDLQTAQGGRSSIAEKLGAYGLCFVLFIWVLVWGALFFSDAYATARQTILHDALLQKSIGQVNRVLIRPEGQVQMQSSAAGSAGTAELHLIAEGEHQFQDVQVFLSKEPADTAWIVRKMMRE